MRIHSLKNLDEILKPRVHSFQFLRSERVSLGPVGSSAVLEHYLLKGSEQFAIRRVKPIRPE